MPPSAPKRDASDSDRSTRPTLRRILLAAMTGALMVLSFPRYGSELGIEHLIWITPLPLLFAATGVGARQGFFLGWIAGLTLEAAGFSWILLAIRTFSSLPPIFASLLFAVWLWMSALPWGLLGCVLGKIRRPAAVLWVIPFWVALEHYFPRLFPWHVGGALWNTSLAHCVDLLGASGLTALVFLVSAALYLSIESWRGRRLLPWGTLLATIALVIAAFVYAGLRRSSLEERLAASDARLRVGFVQGAIDPRTSTSGIDEVRWYLDATEDLIRREPGLDLIVWPEGAFGIGVPFLVDHPKLSPWTILAQESARDPEKREALARLRGLGVPIVVGAAAVAVDASGRPTDRYNVSVYLRPDGATSIYRKNWRMPFGENLSWIPDWVRSQFGLTHVGGLTAGRENPVFHLGERPFRNLICYEAVLPYYVRPSADGAELLVNITEDIWYGDTAHVPQHLSVLVLRSIESRVPIVRVTNVGPSGIVDATGEFRAGSGTFEPAAFALDLVPYETRTLYEIGGFAFPALAGLIAVGRFAIFLIRRTDSRHAT